MKPIQEIVVPVDFDQHTDTLVEFAISMADLLSAQLHFIHVSEPYEGYGAPLENLAYQDIEKQIRAAAEKKMAQLIVESSEKNTNCTGKVVNGEVVDEIVAYTEEENAGMIIIGTHGTKGLKKILLGNVAERVVHRAPCPVLLFNPYR